MLLDVRDLRIGFERPGGIAEIIRGINFTIRSGEFFSLVGESGSGKSITCLSLMSLLGKNSKVRGESLLNGRSLLDQRRSIEDRRSGIAMVFQNATQALNPVRTVGFQLTETLSTHSRDRGSKNTRHQARELLEEVGLYPADAILKRYPHQLSGGMNQRVMIALALARQPKLLIADEPTSALDVTVQAQILSLIDRLRRDKNMGVLFVTHDLALAEERSNQLGILRDGAMVECGESNAVLVNPTHPYTRRLWDALPKLDVGERVEEGATVDVAALQEQQAAVSTDLHSDKPGLALAVRNLAFSYPRRGWSILDKAKQRPVVHTVSFDVRQGEAVGLIGESGSGKSTIAKLILGLLAPETGSIDVLGRPISTYTRQLFCRTIQPVFQDPLDALDPRIAVGDQIIEPMIALKICSKNEARDRVAEFLPRVGLDAAISSRLPHQISGGQAQRIVIARALAANPSILICDEPVSALDMSRQAQILDLLKDLQNDLGLTCLFISHDLRAVSSLCDRVLVLHQGQLVEQGLTRQVIRAPAHPYTKALIEAVPKSHADGSVGEARLVESL